MALAVPKIWRISAQSTTFTPDPLCDWFEVHIVAGGGGGAGTQNTTGIPPSLYGLRGGDSFFHFKPGVNSMFALAPGGTTVYTAQPHGLVEDQAVYLENIPAGVSLSTNTPYYVHVLTTTQFQLYTEPYSPPGYITRTVVTATPIGQNPTITWKAVWWGVQGGGGGGVIGDQGTPLGSWGFAAPGPAGYVQSAAWQGGCGSAAWRSGGPGGVNLWGGNSGTTYLDFGIAGTNLTGAGGGGASPDLTVPGIEWGGTGGAAGAAGVIYMKADTAPNYFCRAGAGGAGGPAGTNGYPGGAGGHGQIYIIQH